MISEIVKDNDTRGLASYKHAWQMTPRLSAKVDANVVSDDNLLRDYADRLADRTRQRAETNVFVSQSWDRWSLVGNILWYQDSDDEPPGGASACPRHPPRGADAAHTRTARLPL